MGETIEYRNVWRKDDAKVRADALDLWRSLNILPPGQEDDRLNSLCVVAYVGEELAAVSTIGINMFPAVKAKVAWFRCLVKPEYRQRSIAKELGHRCKDAMEEWSAGRPAEKVLAYGTIVESPHLTHISRMPVWPKSGLTLVGHTGKGQQIRIAWFKHAYFGEKPNTKKRETATEISNVAGVIESDHALN